MNVLIGIMIPFIGTFLGAASVFLLKGEMKPRSKRLPLGFAGGVMVAASVWSLIIPAIEQSQHMGRFSFLPSVIGFFAGVFFLLIVDKLTLYISQSDDQLKKSKSHLKDTTKLLIAVTIHNIPEGMAVGVAFAGLLSDADLITMSGAMALSIGIAIQNFPEGAIISIPLQSKGMSKFRAFVAGTLSGAVEPVAACVTILLANAVVPIMPYLLSFAAGAMMYVVVEELIPDISKNGRSNAGVISFATGFAIMMALDVALG